MVDNDELRSVAFNMSLQLIQHISELLKMSDNYFLQGAYSRSLDCLIVIRYNIHQNLSKEEQKSLDGLLKKARLTIQCNNKLINIGRTFNKPPKHLVIFVNKNPISDVVINYRKLIQEDLEKYGYLIKKVDDLKKMF